MKNKTEYPGKLDPPLNETAVFHLDRFIVFNRRLRRIVESQGSEGRAQHACEVLNEHERKLNNSPVDAYFYFQQ